MERLYLTTSSLNFNNIFSTESISPVNYYSRRKYGYKRFEAVSPNPFPNSILLYSKYPKFEIRDYEQDNYPIVFDIPKSLVSDKISLVKTFDDIEIFQMSRTIYLNPFEIYVFFPSDKSLHTTLLKSESSLDTKMVSVYKSCFLKENDSVEKFIWSNNVIKEINDINDIESLNFIEVDKKINRIKGFAYCYLIGANNYLSVEILELKRLLKEIKNISSGLFNIYNSGSISNDKSNSKKQHLTKDTINRLEEFNNKVSRFITLIDIIDPQRQNKQRDFEKEIFSKFGISDSEIEKIINLLKSYKSYRETLYEHFQWAIQNKSQTQKANEWVTNLQQLSATMNSIFSNNVVPQKYLRLTDFDVIWGQLEESLLTLEENFRSQNEKINIVDAFSISNLRLTSLNDIYLKNKVEFYQGIINTLIDIPIESVDEFKSSKADIVRSCGAILKEYVEENTKREWATSIERTFINTLLDNIESYQPFNLKSHPSEILQSFAAFIIKGEEPEKLKDYLIANNIRDFRSGLGFWGALFGFASIPRTLTESFLTSDSTYINSFFKSLTKQLFDYELSNLSKESVLQNIGVDVIKEEDEEKQENKIFKPSSNEFKVEENSNFDRSGIIFCPICNSEMKLRKGAYGEFYGCSRYPKCNGKRQIRELDSDYKENSNLSSIIIDLVKRSGHCKISDLQAEIKAKTNKSYNIGEIETYIKQNLFEELELKKKDRANGVLMRDNGLF